MMCESRDKRQVHSDPGHLQEEKRTCTEKAGVCGTLLVELSATEMKSQGQISGNYI
jgi:hypothetical protein